MKWYFAAQFARLEELRAYVAEVRASTDLVVTSRWLDQDPATGYAGGSDEAGRVFAERDLEDINAADALLFFAEDPSVGIPRGGRHVEMGYALAQNKLIEVVGPRENVFHLLSSLRHYLTFEAWLETKKAEVK